MQVLKDLILREGPRQGTSDVEPERFGVDATTDVQYRLLCIVTAFELLSGQGSSFRQIIRPAASECRTDRRSTQY